MLGAEGRHALDGRLVSMLEDAARRIERCSMRSAVTLDGISAIITVWEATRPSTLFANVTLEEFERMKVDA